MSVKSKKQKKTAPAAKPHAQAKPAKTKPPSPAKPAQRSAQRPPRPGLGRGLGALIGTEPTAAPELAAASPSPLIKTGRGAEDIDKLAVAAPVRETGPDGATLTLVPVAEISRSPWQPRQNFDEEAMRELAESIRAHGLIQPLVCRRNDEGRYELIAGERRLRAALAAGLERVPVVLVEAENRHAAEMAIIENIQRQDLNVIEEAEGYRTLAETFGLTQQDVAERVGKARATVANALRLLDLPDEVKQLVSSSLLSTGHAKVLLGLTDVTEQTLLGRKCVTEELTVRALERVIQRRRAAAAGVDVRRPGKPDLPESYVRDLSDRLHRHFGTAVRLTPGMTHANGRHSKGVLEIDFYDNEDLDRLLGLLGVAVE